MKKRILTGTVYVIVLAGLIVLKWLVPGGFGSIGFDVLFTAISVLGCLELLRALKENSVPQKTVAIAYCAVIVPLYAVAEMTIGLGWLAAVICSVVYVAAIAVFRLTRFGEDYKKGTADALFAMGYCGALCCVLSAVNHLSNSTPAIILLFLTITLTDCTAFLVGISLGKVLPHKLAPKISPNKTVAGSVGGIIGGVAGAIIAYFLFYGVSGLHYEVVEGVNKLVSSFTVDSLTLVWFALIGFIASLAGQAGDLFESYVKRRCGIKDMGKILPGHGGVLDRFDSMLFAGVVALLGFILIAL